MATASGQGYSTAEIYFNNGIGDRFTSLCLSYSETERDIVCGTRDPAADFLIEEAKARGLAIHNQYVDPSGGAALVAEFLAGQLS